jgi:hypothetical protein
MRCIGIAFLLVMGIGITNSFAQSTGSPLNIFGYFQNSFQYWPKSKAKTTHPQYFNPIEQPAQNSFNMQQLNLFLGKDLSRHWRAFVNFEILNSFSSQRQWGAFNLEEAWVRYKPSDKFNIKLGLMIPVFNNLNEIKNRTPLLPYIIRPLIYETSFSEFFSGIEEGAPARAFVQASGVIPSGKVKLDYALYIGNSPNINSDPNEGQTGVDTTNAILLGGRIGIRLKDFKIGFSTTHENIDLRLVDIGIARYEFIYKKAPRIRLGGDLSFHIRRFSFEGEITAAKYDDISEIRIDGVISNDNHGEINFDGKFYYGTLGYQISEQIFAYASYWNVVHEFPFIVAQTPSLLTTVGATTIDGPTVGVSFKLIDRLTFKGQYVLVNIKDNLPFPYSNDKIIVENKYNIFAIAASVFF